MSRINWDNPPSRRKVSNYLGQHLVFDFVVAATALFVARLLWRAMQGATDVSAQGVREYFVRGQSSSAFLVWGVLVVCLLAASYAIIDATLALLRHRNDARLLVSKAQEIETQEEKTT